MKDSRSRNGSKRTAPRRKAPTPSARKRRINLSLTPLAYECLECSALRLGVTKSEEIEGWIRAEVAINGGLSPLGLGSKRKGRKGMRGQAISYGEVKQQVTLSLSPTAIKYLGTLARKADCSRSELVERRLRSLWEIISLLPETCGVRKAS